MNEPRRLSESGGVSQRLLDSASIDKPSAAARRRAALLAATASSFATSNPRGSVTPLVRPNLAKTLATWIFVGAAASGTLALLGSKLFDATPQQAGSIHGVAAPVLAELPPTPSAAPARSPDIAAEPNGTAVKVPTIAATPVAPSATVDEAREIDAARAAIARGDYSGAIAALDGYDKSHPNAPLEADAMALRIQALRSAGKTSEARKLASEFQSRFPQRPLK